MSGIGGGDTEVALLSCLIVLYPPIVTVGVLKI